MSAHQMFVWGFFGSCAAELASAAVITSSEKWKLPDHYFIPSFWIVRALLACIGGGLALAHSAPTPLLCLHIGVATPFIIQAFAKNAPKAAATE